MVYLQGTSMMLMYTMCVSRIVEAAPQLVDHVIVLGIDGLGGAKAEQLMSSGVMPNLADIRASSIYSMHCRGDFPTSSATNWHAIMAGASAEMTGVDSNNWLATQPDIADVNGICHNTPTIFSLLRSQRPNATSALVSGWEALLGIAYPKTDITHTVYHEHVEDSADEIIRILSADHPPEFTMLQINELDEAGHGHGYGDEFNKEAARVDVQIGRMVSFVQNSTVMWKKTMLLIVADHGREPDGYNHGGLTTLELETMWLALSPVLDTAHELTPVGRSLVTPIRSVDTAPTAAYALGLEIPIQWRGHPVRELFNSSSFGLNYKWPPNDRCDAQLSGVVLYTHQPSYVLGLWNGVILTFSVHTESCTGDDAVVRLQMMAPSRRIRTIVTPLR
ncbi:hypothetical protein, variant [Sphaeroforma arctica JP610]|uniref:Metalloenzyme domain-containing protein n=1 Tax=Sphaeroforma arctica JP610 TaxID=667725 RepID=A0A0L0GA84_9EUKA|nr:hypothetical protein, variant [Sphaeroforma arctica JP610]KNC85910.1 hypothetical protein, variant [Sphaeroforma arctica JP610]|eukprot:XP_014159812.1 hypothetical protein, variant [Sphaeroforma arctica JP610]